MVLSPHLDDAALSLGAGLAEAAAHGTDVTVLTVLANDPAASGPASAFEAACGFDSAADAARARRTEDRLACTELGATPVWLPFGDMEYGLGTEEAVVRRAIVDAVTGADSVLVPGFPLDQPDHAWLAQLVLEDPPTGVAVGLYVEQPYATLRLIGRGRRTWSAGLTTGAGVRNLLHVAVPTRTGRALVEAGLPDALSAFTHSRPEWQPLRGSRAARAAKSRAVRAYESQIREFGPLVLERIAAYERAAGGEQVAWLPAPDG